MKAKDSQF